MKKLVFLAAILTISLSSLAQYKWDYGIAIGGANYLGDIGGLEKTRRDFVLDMHLHRTHVAAGLYGRYKFGKRLSAAANFSYLHIRDADKFSTNPARRARNLNFRNNIFELGLRGELTIFYDNDVGGRGYYNPDFKFYLFGGVAGFYHNPQGQIFKEGELQYGGEWYNLRPWETEGVSYSALGVSIPAGVGLYFTFDKIWRIGWELSWRTTFTDYLDDISTVYVDPATLPDDKAREFYSQTYSGLVQEINADPTLDASLSVNQFRYLGDGAAPNKRGQADNNDSYLSTQLTIGRVIRGRSQFYRKKYSWLRSRTGSRRSRAKF